jgi:hypothetical protein
LGVLSDSAAGKQPYSITPLTTLNFQIHASPAFQKTPINTVDVYVIYFQSMFNFPSWHPGACSPRKSMKVGQQLAELVAARNVFRPWTSARFSPDPDYRAAVSTLRVVGFCVAYLSPMYFR